MLTQQKLMINFFKKGCYMSNLVTIYGRGAEHLKPAYYDNKCMLGNFVNGEIRVELQQSIRGLKIVIIQSFRVSSFSEKQLSVNDLWVETLLICDAAKRAGAAEIILICPFIPYTRQDKKHVQGVPLSAKILMDSLAATGIDRFITFDLHAEQISGFMKNKVLFDHISLLPYLAAWFQYMLEIELTDEMIMCSTDAGSAVRTKKMGDYLKIENLAMISKIRDKPGSVASGKLVGNVKNKFCVLVDDMIDSGGTLVNAHKLLKEGGARKIAVIAVHGIFSVSAVEKLSVFDHVLVSNTLPPMAKTEGGIKRMSIDQFMTKLLFCVDKNAPVDFLMNVDTWY